MADEDYWENLEYQEQLENLLNNTDKDEQDVQDLEDLRAYKEPKKHYNPLQEEDDSHNYEHYD